MNSMRLSVRSQVHTGRVRWQCTLYRRPPLCAANTAAAAKQLSALGEDPTGLSRPEPAGPTWRYEAVGRRCSWLGLNSKFFCCRLFFFAFSQFSDIWVKVSSVATILRFQGRESDMDRVEDGEKTDCDTSRLFSAEGEERTLELFGQMSLED